MHALGGGTGDKADASHRRMDTQELVTSSCSAGASQDLAPRGNVARQLLELLPQREHEMEDIVATDGFVKLSALSKKLIDRWSGEGNPALNHHT